MFFDVLRRKKPSVLGFCIGAVVGLVAITPGAGFVAIPQSLSIDVVAAVISNLPVEWKSRSSLDDTLAIFPCHGIGGVVSTEESRGGTEVVVIRCKLWWQSLKKK